MLSILRAINPFTVTACCLLIASGCNAFEFLHNDDTDDPDVLLEDARIAMQQGDPAKAIDLLEKALQTAPDDAEIKVLLSSALFQSHDIDLLLLKDLADFISAEQPQAGKGQRFSSQACNFDGDPESTTSLQLEDAAAYATLFENIETLQRAGALLQHLFEDDSAAELDDNARSNARLMRAIAFVAVSVIEINVETEAVQATLHRLPTGGIGYCAQDASTLAALESFILCEKMPAIDHAIEDLVARQHLFAAGDNELVTALSSARNELAHAISPSCQTVN